MDEGQSKQYTQQDYRNYYNYYYPRHLKGTKTAITVMSIALLFLVLSQIFNTIFLLIINLIFSAGSSNLQFAAQSAASMVTAGTFALFGALFFFISFIIIIIATILFYTSSYESNENHNKNVWLALIFCSGFVFCVVFGFIVGSPFQAFLEFSPLVISIRYAFFTFLGLLENFFLAFLIILPIRELAGKREMDLLYIFAGYIILIPVIQEIYVLYRLDANPLVFAIFTIGFTIAFAFALIAYFNISKWLKTHDNKIPVESKRLLPRPQPFSNYAHKFYSKPIQALVIMVVLSVVLGTAGGVRIYSSLGGPLIDADPEEITFDNEGFEDWTESMSGSLMEGESESVHFNYDPYETGIDIKLTWTDESDYIGRTNQPDRFSLEIQVGEVVKFNEAENQHGGVGTIETTIDLLAISDYYNSGSVVITLVSAGDQVGPFGVPGSPTTISDNSNEFSLDISHSY